jgi:hypothetical protein
MVATNDLGRRKESYTGAAQEWSGGMKVSQAGRGALRQISDGVVGHCSVQWCC